MHEHSSSRRRRTSVGTGTLALSLGLCLCAGQLLATQPASAASTQAVTAAAVAKIRPAVRTNISTGTVKRGQRVRITARYLNPRNGKAVTSGTVRLQTLNAGRWVTTTAQRLGKSGTVNLYDTPKVNRYFRTQFLGTSAFLPLTGGKIRIMVRQPSSGAGTRILAEARAHTGALYLFAAAGPKRFDCSGYTMYVYRKAVGKSLPHKANSQQHYGVGVAKSQARVGDLIVYRNGSYGYHAGIYAGGGYMYDSPHTGARVGKHKMYGGNYVVRRLAA